MADTSNRGLGSDNMDPEVKQEIQSEGGKASHDGGASSGQKGGESTSSGDGRGNFGNPEQHSEAGKHGGEE